MFFDINKQTLKNIEALRYFSIPGKNKNKEQIYEDNFNVSYRDVNHEIMPDFEIPNYQGSVLFYDVESFPNYFLAAFRHLGTGKIISWEFCEQTNSYPNVEKLAYLMNRFTVVGFNSRIYDLPMITLAMAGATTDELNQASFKIIGENMFPNDFEKEYDVKIPYLKHVDLIDVAPLSASLKTYAARLNCKRMQDLPVNPSKPLSKEEMYTTRVYCFNDLANTELLCKELNEALNLRKEISTQYEINVLSKSDAQIAESIIGKEFQKLTGNWPSKTAIEMGKTHFYKAPDFIKYKNPVLKNMLELVCSTPFIVQSNGYITMPEEIEKLEIKIGRCNYKMGIGGLHSSEKSVVHRANENTLLIDSDVASYYPMIILNQKLFPKHLGKQFLIIYKSIVDRRLKAKATGDKKTAASLKIAINGSFGKMGNPYSFLYSPELMLQVTISGQLCLLLLIDYLEQCGFSVISANTDGIIVECPADKYSDYISVIKYWENVTGFVTEETRYSEIYSRDVNNYIAIKTNGEIKRKGIYSEKGSAMDSRLSKNPETFVCLDALIDYLTKDISIEKSIKSCKDILRFCTVRNVRGGAVKSGVYLGKVVRWYYSTEMKGQINYLISGNKVPKSDGARPLMELEDDFPNDIDYEKYIAIVEEMLVDIGVKESPIKIRRKATCDLAPKFKF